MLMNINNIIFVLCTCLYNISVIIAAPPTADSYKTPDSLEIKKNEQDGNSNQLFNANQSRQANDNNGQQQTGFNPVQAIQNLFNGQNGTQNVNGQNNLNPLQSLQNQLTGQNNNPLNDVKLFMVNTQGIIMPASVLANGALNVLSGLGNMGNMAQNVGSAFGNLLPTGKK